MPEVKNSQFKKCIVDFNSLKETFDGMEAINSVSDVDTSDWKYGVEADKEYRERFVCSCDSFLMTWKEGFFDGITLRQKQDDYQEMINSVQNMKEEVECSFKYIDEVLNSMSEGGY